MRLMLLIMMAAASAPLEQQLTGKVKVTLKQGIILGSREEAINGKVYYSFLTIPYAKPPVGALRLKEPRPADGWSGVRNGSLPIPTCPQLSFMKNFSYEGQEDCLYLNVYTPRPYTSSLPVMVYIHGGGFAHGSAMDTASPAPLMQKEVVVVAMNYRLGALGFLSTGDSVLPGNLGLKDQSLALRWVQDNIRDLGGDPQQVTIFGVSAGGMSVHYHILSPKSAGLFQRAIMQSGTALLDGINSSRESAIKISSALNCTGEESNQLMTCFREAAVEDLVTHQFINNEWDYMPATVGPRVDGEFLPDHPALLLRTGCYNKVDVMSGTTADDGNVFTAGFFTPRGAKALMELNNNFTKVGPILLSFTKEENPLYLARRVFLRYMVDLKVNATEEHALTLITGDRMFQVPCEQTVEFLAKDTDHKTFTYVLQHQSHQTLMSLFMNSTISRKMAGHGDELLYLFSSPPPMKLTRHQDLHVQDIFVNLWTNFVSTGNPTVNGTLGFRWTPVAPNGKLKYLSISTTPTMQFISYTHRRFWNSLPTKTNKILYPELFLEEKDEATV